MFDSKLMATWIVPKGLNFSDLALAREPDGGDLSFNVTALERFCKGNNLDVDSLLEGDDDELCLVIYRWYQIHLAQGGAPDPIQSMIIAEIEVEDLYGEARVIQGPSHLQ